MKNSPHRIGRTILVVAAVLALGGAYFFAHLSVPRTPDRYPEFRAVSGVLKNRMLAD